MNEKSTASEQMIFHLLGSCESHPPAMPGNADCYHDCTERPGYVPDRLEME